MMPLDAEIEFIGLYEAHYDEILAYCARRTSSAEADEVAAEVFTIAWRRLDKIDADTARGWLFGVARGVLANSWRSTQRRTRLMDRVRGTATEPTESIDELAQRRGEHAEVLTALSRLRSSDQEVLMLAAWEELTGREIAQALDVSIAAAEQRLHRAKKRLAKTLAPSFSPLSRSPRVAEGQGGS